MAMTNPTSELENLHPSLWRASQLARSAGRCIDTGHLPLSMQLAGGGWPTGSLIELLIQQSGIGELRLLTPALRKVANRKIVMIQPPQTPNALSLASMGIAPANLLWIKSSATADTLWAAEQVLRSGSCGAVVEDERKRHLLST
jgi:protein ImuA